MMRLRSLTHRQKERMPESPINPDVAVAALQIAEQLQKGYTPDFQETQSASQALQQRARLVGDLAYEIMRGLRDGPAAPQK
jgi:hypothetical protein